MKRSAEPPNFDKLFIEVLALAGRLKRPMFRQGADLDVAPHRVMQVLVHQGPLTVPQIGRLLGTTRQNIQVVVNRLKAEGWIEIVLNPAHERSLLIQATERGKTLVTPSMEEEARIFGELNDRFSQSDVKDATELLCRVRAQLESSRRRVSEVGEIGEEESAGESRIERQGDVAAAGLRHSRAPDERSRAPGNDSRASRVARASEPIEVEDHELPVNLL